MDGRMPPREVHLYYTPTAFKVDATLCRNEDCDQRHVFPIDIVFAVHNRGPPRKWLAVSKEAPASSPTSESVQRDEKSKPTKGKVTVDRRHMFTLGARRHPTDRQFDTRPEDAWTAMRDRMQECGTYLSNDDLLKYKELIKERTLSFIANMKKRNLKGIDLPTNDVGSSGKSTVDQLVDVCYRAFAHLIFDTANFEAVKSNGVEEYVVSRDTLVDICIPAGMKKELRRQWKMDFGKLTMDVYFEILNPRCTKRNCDCPASEARWRRENKQLYDANKDLVTANVAIGQKEAAIAAKMNVLATKIESAVSVPVEEGTSELHRLMFAIDLLLQHQPSSQNAAQSDADLELDRQVNTLSVQMEKATKLSESLQTEINDARQQLVALRQPQKEAVSNGE